MNEQSITKWSESVLCNQSKENSQLHHVEIFSYGTEGDELEIIFWSKPPPICRVECRLGAHLPYNLPDLYSSHWTTTTWLCRPGPVCRRWLEVISYNTNDNRRRRNQNLSLITCLRHVIQIIYLYRWADDGHDLVYKLYYYRHGVDIRMLFVLQLLLS